MRSSLDTPESPHEKDTSSKKVDAVKKRTTWDAMEWMTNSFQQGNIATLVLCICFLLAVVLYTYTAAGDFSWFGDVRSAVWAQERDASDSSFAAAHTSTEGKRGSTNALTASGAVLPTGSAKDSGATEFFKTAGSFQCPQDHYFTRSEIAEHTTLDDLWVVIDGNVLDMSYFVSRHPGGSVLLEGAGGQDMAIVFAQFHHPSTVQLFPSFCIGRLKVE